MTVSVNKPRNTLAGIGRKDIVKGALRTHTVAEIEKETIIVFNEADRECHIFSYNKRWQRHIELRFGIKGAENGFGGRTYIIDKSRLSLPRPKRVMTEQSRKKAAARMSGLQSRRKKAAAKP